MRKSTLSTVIILALCLLTSGLLSAQDKMVTYKKEAVEWIDNNREALDDAATKIWEYAELALLEYESAGLLANYIEDHGFTVERGVAGMPTAFVATYGSGSPIIGILGEYDALPGLSQEVSNPIQAPIEEGAPGHGCGHNIFGVASAGAAIAVKEVMEKHELQGTVRFYGCPAEETVVGKVYMAKEGFFDDLDICLDWHPGRNNSVGLGTSNALNNFEVTFYGKTAHGAGDPWNGRSSLDGVELMNVGVNFLREHVYPTVRMHYVIPNAGQAPNVVPDYAKVWYFVRGKDREEVDEVYARVLKIAEGAALMSDTRHEVYLITGVYNYLKNREVASIIHKNLVEIGAPQFTEEEQEYAREMQRFLNKDEDGFSTEILPFEDPKGYLGGGSTDVADVSWIVPTAALSTACSPKNVPGHSWAITSSVGSSAGMKGMRIAAKVLATAGIEILLDPSIIEKAKLEFSKKTEDFIYKSAVPKDQKARLPKKKGH